MTEGGPGSGTVSAIETETGIMGGSGIGTGSATETGIESGSGIEAAPTNHASAGSDTRRPKLTIVTAGMLTAG